MRKLLAVGITAFALLLVSAPAAAQDDGSNRSGFWLNVGLGYGSAKLDCDGCNVDSEGALAGNLALGFTLSPKLLLGVESNGWAKEVQGIDFQAWNVSGVVYFYPMTSPFFLKGGVGVGGLTASANGQDESESGFGFMAGAGYDFDLSGGKFAISPYALYRYASLGDISGLGNSFTVGVFQFGASFTLH